jgi:hypothetical protein
VREPEQGEAKSCCAFPVERQHRVRRGPEEQRLRVLRPKPTCHVPGTLDRHRSETPCTPRLSCQTRNRSQKEGCDFERRPDQTGVLGPERVGGAADEQGGAVVERMRERGGRLDPVDVELERPEERRGGGERMDCRADVVPEAWECQLGRARAAADAVLRLEDEDRAPGLREGGRGGEPVRAGADDDGV